MDTIEAKPVRDRVPATGLTVVTLLVTAAAIAFLATCDPGVLSRLGEKSAAVGRSGTWATAMAWRPIICGMAAFVLVGAAAVLWTMRSTYERACDTAGAWLVKWLTVDTGVAHGGLGRSERVVLLALVVARIPTIPWANFVRDDFEILTANRTNSLAANLILQHGDHAYPLYRLQVWVCDGLFGTWAPGWNILLIATYAAAMWLAAKSARTLGARSIPTAVALAVFGMSWTMGLLHAGYYVLSTTVQIAAAAFAAFLCYTLAEQRRQIRWIPLGTVVLLAGCLLDISGVWILGAVPLLLLVSGNERWTFEGLAQWIQSHAVWVWTWIATACTVGAVHGSIYLSSRSDFLSMSDYFATPLTLPGALRQFFFLFASGTLLQLLCPLAAYLPWPVHVVCLAGAVVLTTFAVRAATSREQASILAVVAIMAGFALEVAIGRPQENQTFFPQYVATLNILSVPLLAILLTVFGRGASWQPGNTLCGAAGVALVAVTVAVALTSWIPAYAAYVVGLRANQILLQDIARLSDELAALVDDDAGARVPAFPAIDGRQFRAAMPRWPTRAGLAPYNLSHYRHFMSPKLRSYPLVRNAYMTPWVAPDVVTVVSVREACGPALITSVAKLPELRAVLSAPIDLTPVALERPLPIVMEANRRIVESDGSTVVSICSEPFDPEAFPRLLFDFSPPAFQSRITLRLRATLSDGTVTEVGLPISAASTMPTTVNLLESPWLAVQPLLRNLSLVLTQPGQYTIRQLSLLEKTPPRELLNQQNANIPL